MVPPAPSPSRAAEATAACRIDLAGGVLFALPAGAHPEEGRSVAVAVDRRAFARVEAGTSRGIEIESKDTLLKVAAADVSALSSDGLVGLVRRVLKGLDLETGLRVVTQARVPFGAGLASAGALAIAVAAAAARAAGREVSAEGLATVGRLAEAALGGERMEPAGALAAVLGGVTCAPLASGPGTRLGVDAARVEECLLLVDPASGPGAGSPSGTESAATQREAEAWAAGGAGGRLAEIAALADRAREALESGRLSEMTGVLRAEHRARAGLLPGEAGGRIRPIVAIAEAAGGGARLCGSGPASLVLVWAEPGARSAGPREGAVRELKAAGYRLFPCRVDLRGLEVEDV